MRARPPSIRRGARWFLRWGCLEPTVRRVGPGLRRRIAVDAVLDVVDRVDDPVRATACRVTGAVGQVAAARLTTAAAHVCIAGVAADLGPVAVPRAQVV